MAFYQNMPGQKKPKTNYGNTGSWDDEGAHYSGRSSEGRAPGDRYEQKDHRNGNRFADRKPDFRRGEDDRRSYGKRYNDHKPDFHRNDGHGSGDRRPTGRSFGDRPDQFRRNERYEDNERRPYGRNFGDRKPDFRHDEKRTDRRPAEKIPHGFEERKFEARRFETEEPRDHRDFEFRSPESMPQPYGEDRNENMLSGRNPIREALKNGRDIEKLLVQKGELSGSAREIVQMAKEARIVVQEVDKQRLDELTPHHQGLIAFASAYQYATVEEMLELAEAKEEAPFLILLDGVTDPHNLGAIIRSAECAGAHGVIVPERRSVGLTPAAVKAAAGAIEHVKVARVVNLNRTIEDLKKRGIWAYAVTMDGKDYEKMDFKGGTALVVGAEGEGISRLTRECCDCAVSLPMMGEINSLNASVAAGVMMYRVLSCRRK